MKKANKYMKFKFCTKQIDTKCKLIKYENQARALCTLLRSSLCSLK